MLATKSFLILSFSTLQCDFMEDFQGQFYSFTSREKKRKEKKPYFPMPKFKLSSFLTRTMSRAFQGSLGHPSLSLHLISTSTL
jgi:hypothetical protein